MYCTILLLGPFGKDIREVVSGQEAQSRTLNELWMERKLSVVVEGLQSYP